ncbi:hypothetical protein CHU98_g10980 [Xylaria longipes]|nr:hypothetical protein CHU98_g10980 [Xylaria longipes]
MATSHSMNQIRSADECEMNIQDAAAFDVLRLDSAGKILCLENSIRFFEVPDIEASIRLLVDVGIRIHGFRNGYESAEKVHATQLNPTGSITLN